MKRLFCAVLAVLLLCGAVLAEDTPTLDAQAAALITNGLIYLDEDASPEDVVTRIGAVAAVVDLLGLDRLIDSFDAPPFTDTASLRGWDAYSLGLATSAGLVSADAGQAFRPDEPATCAMFAAMLLRGMYPEEAAAFTEEGIAAAYAEKGLLADGQTLPGDAPLLLAQVIELAYAVYLPVARVRAEAMDAAIPLQKGVPAAVPVDALVLVQLDANMTTGYEWSYTLSDEAVLTLFDQHYETDDVTHIEAAGAGGTERFYFRAAAPGTCTISLQYTRPREDTIPGTPVTTFEVTVLP